jgi:hypothetical protein
MLRSYAPRPRWSGTPPRGALVRSIAQYLEERGELLPTLPTPTERQITDYHHYLERVFGFCASTIAMKSATAREFLLFVRVPSDKPVASFALFGAANVLSAVPPQSVP